jgi:hypothetical protein
MDSKVLYDTPEHFAELCVRELPHGVSRRAREERVRIIAKFIAMYGEKLKASNDSLISCIAWLVEKLKDESEIEASR